MAAAEASGPARSKVLVGCPQSKLQVGFGAPFQEAFRGTWTCLVVALAPSSLGEGYGRLGLVLDQVKPRRKFPEGAVLSFAGLGNDNNS